MDFVVRQRIFLLRSRWKGCQQHLDHTMVEECKNDPDPNSSININTNISTTDININVNTMRSFCHDLSPNTKNFNVSCGSRLNHQSLRDRGMFMYFICIIYVYAL